MHRGTICQDISFKAYFIIFSVFFGRKSENGWEFCRQFLDSVWSPLNFAFFNFYLVNILKNTKMFLIFRENPLSKRGRQMYDLKIMVTIIVNLISNLLKSFSIIQILSVIEIFLKSVQKVKIPLQWLPWSPIFPRKIIHAKIPLLSNNESDK